MSYIDPSLMQYSGKIVTTVDYGTTYGITDTDGIIDFFIQFHCTNISIMF